MAPVATSPPASPAVRASAAPKKLPTKDPKYNQYSQLHNEHFDQNQLAREADYPFNDFKPSFPVVDWAPLEVFEPAKDRAHFADPEKKALLSAASKVIDVTKTIGTELHGIRLRELSDQQKDELALLIAERGVVFFRNQDDLTIEDQRALGAYYGKLHRHATTGVPARGDLDDVHVVYTHPDDVDPSTQNVYRGPSAHSRVDLWHSDVTYELQPPSYTSFKLYTSPQAGGDTLWTSGYAAYDRLSYPMREYLESLTAIHSAVDQATGAARAGHHVRRKPIETEHPLVRVHPVTGWRSLWFNPGFVRYIVGVPKAESDYLVAFLSAHVSTGTDFSVRFKYGTNDVAFWDNRVTTHSAILEDVGVSRRHALRVAATGEVPIPVSQAPESKSREEELFAKRGYKIDRAVAHGTRRQAGYKD